MFWVVTLQPVSSSCGGCIFAVFFSIAKLLFNSIPTKMARDYKKGLTPKQVEESRKKHGSNVLTPPEKEPLWKQFLEKFEDPIIRILLIALLLSIGVSVYQLIVGTATWTVLFEPFGILLAVLLATTVGFVFELNANKKFEILNQTEDEQMVTVFRNGLVQRIERKDVVVGDVVVLNTGDEVPADGTLMEAISMRVNESDLTGEPSCSKTTVKAEFKPDATYPSNYVCRGSTVMEGHGVFIVEKVGDATEWGKVYSGAQIDNKVKTPLNEQLDRLGHGITIASYVIAGLILVLRVLMYFIYATDAPIDWMDFVRYILNTLMIAVTLIVVAVPEGLPMSVTLSLAMSMRRMLETNNLVRKMHACETMGAATVICTDKTGTLTKNRMSLGESLFFGLRDGKLDDSEVSHLLQENIALNSTAFLDYSDQQKVKVVGNPTEGALLLWLFDNNIDFVRIRDNGQIVKQLPFTTKYKYMATIVKTPFAGEYVLYVKGAPEILLKRCATVKLVDREAGIQWAKDEVESKLIEYQSKAMRTLGFAYKYLTEEEVKTVFENGKLTVEDLCFLGIVGIIDPIRDDVSDAVQNCLNAGIGIKIVTGDTPGTAREIGRQVGLWTEDDRPERQMITGKEFNLLTDEQLKERIGDLKIMSRARPSDKERLVRLLQEQGEVVAVTGDGTNDAPALNKAQIGLSMGDGTTVAKEASDITILDNSFRSIVRAVMWGRSLYLNIQRFILFQMTVNVAACLIVLIGAMVGTSSPLTVTQMLWINLIMDTFAAMALASLPPDSAVLSDKPRSREAYIISKGMARRIFGLGLLFVAVLFGFIQYFMHFGVDSLAEFSLRDYFVGYFNFNHLGGRFTPREVTMLFTIFVFMQFWNIFNAKAYHTGQSALKGFLNKDVRRGFGLTLLIIAVGQVLIVTFGGEMFSVVPLPLGDWLRIVVFTSLILWIGEIGRWLKKMKTAKKN
ncbi:MAG: calcium-translocating P-type ATPase, PMCA-type [Bacteroidales bacterium]|nr:calcium-translocating P-type ATPase, PMCA-type [Bacteroidales bacterium]